MEISSENFDLRRLVSGVNAMRFKTYLIARGWEERSSRYADHLCFELKIDDGPDSYDLYVPVSKDVPKYNTRMMRAIYKLCGIEDREPIDITREVVASVEAIEIPAAHGSTNRLQLRNTGSSRLQLCITSPAREHVLLPGEAIELSYPASPDGLLKMECADGSLKIYGQT